MRHLVDSVLITVIGQVNRFVYLSSGGRIILYRSFGFPGRLLTIIGPQSVIGRPLLVSCLPDEGDHIVMVREPEDSSLHEALDTCTAASMQFGDRWVPVDVIMLRDQNERSILLNRLLRKASISERHQIARHHMIPIARVRLRNPINDVSIAVSGIWSP